MDWNVNLRIPFASGPDQKSYYYSSLYNHNYDHDFPEITTLMMDKRTVNIHPKKKRLSNEQLESLENSFQEEIKLDPERKVKLAKELGLQPRQIAVWFQNRRARWKAKQLELLYGALKKEYDAVSRERHRLQQEVLALRGIIKNQIFPDHTTEETVLSSSINPTSRSDDPGDTNYRSDQIPNYHVLHEDDYDPMTTMTPSPSWAAFVN